ncbi:hypothetical protein ES703_123896 [subsurface metagenome]
MSLTPAFDNKLPDCYGSDVLRAVVPEGLTAKTDN